MPGPEKIFLINPFGLHYREVTASNLVAIDVDGNPVRPTAYPINRAGFVIHSAIHRSVPAAHCVMHTHTTSGMAVACLKSGLSHDSFYGAMLHGRVAYHDFEGVTVEEGEQERMLASIGDKRAVILRNHGLLAWGSSVSEAFMILWTLQRACDVQVGLGRDGRDEPGQRGRVRTGGAGIGPGGGRRVRPRLRRARAADRGEGPGLQELAAPGTCRSIG